MTAGPEADGVDDELDGLVHRADLDGLVRLVDRRCASEDWSGLVRARDRARRAVDTGRQLWPVATLAEYRIALAAPPRWAASMIADDAGLFTIGPLTEVIAQRHTWQELQPLLPAGPAAGIVAHERVLRGEPIDAATIDPFPAIDMPYELAGWEPRYPIPTYSEHGIEAPAPPTPDRTGHPATGRADAERVRDDVTELAVRQLVEPWTTDSNGRAEVAVVVGSMHDAVSALGVPARTATEMPLDAAMAWLAWAGASGGAHGRRRGGAIGRFGALWTVAALLDLSDEWPVPLDELGDVAGDLRWFWWDAGEPVTGWRLQLAVEDRVEGLAWAISARDDT
jgi:resuscitation-promoting factor RpfA